MNLRTLLFILILPVCAAAQGRPGAPDKITLNSEFSGRDGFDSRSAGFDSSFGLGRLGGYAFTANATAAHHRTWSSGWFPGEVYDTALKLNARSRKWSFGAGVRSNSDRPLNSPSETDLSLDASVPLSRRGPHSFTLILAYSSRRSFLRNIPLPFIAYSYVSNDLTFFLPFALNWRISDKTNLAASYFPPKYFSVSLSRMLLRGVTLAAYGGHELDQYLLAGRPDKDYALYLERPYAGLRTTLRLASGYELSVYGEQGFKGRGFFGTRYDDRNSKASIGAGAAAGVSLKKKFGQF